MSEDFDYRRLMDLLYDGVYFVDTKRQITFWNKGAERITGFTAEEVVGRSCSDNVLNHVDETGLCLCQSRCPLAQTISDGESREAEVYLHHKAGHRLPVQVRITPMRDATGNVTGGIELFTDISAQQAEKMRAKELEKLAMLDSLTEIANRNFMNTQIRSRLEEFGSHGWKFGILFMDIDNFKNFNDSYGHEVGDLVLRTVAATLTNDAGPFDLVGRWGGEEFIVVVRNADAALLEKRGERYRFLIEQSYLMHEGERLSVTVSIGGTLVKQGDDQASVIDRADQLMYRGKRAGRNRLTLDVSAEASG